MEKEKKEKNNSKDNFEKDFLGEVDDALLDLDLDFEDDLNETDEQETGAALAGEKASEIDEKKKSKKSRKKRKSKKKSERKSKEKSKKKADSQKTKRTFFGFLKNGYQKLVSSEIASLLLLAALIAMLLLGIFFLGDEFGEKFGEKPSAPKIVEKGSIDLVDQVPGEQISEQSPAESEPADQVELTDVEEQTTDEITAPESEIEAGETTETEEEAATEDGAEAESETAPSTSTWKTYKSSKFYFEVKYPDSWQAPVVEESFIPEAEYSFKVSFAKSAPSEIYSGFDVLVYSDRAYNLEETEPLKLKNPAAFRQELCPTDFEETKLGTAGYPAKKVGVKSGSDCFSEAFFYSVSRNNYIYNFVPVPKNGYNYPGYDGQNQVSENLPEFFEVLDTIRFYTPPPPKPKITAKIPHGAKKIVVNGQVKYVCAKKNDKPKVSSKNPKGHMDMQCCLDPDEVPNPWCTY